MEVVEASRTETTRSWATLQVAHVNDHGHWVFTMSGEADLDTERFLTRELAAAARMGGDCLVVDVSELHFCDVRSAQMILTACRPTPITLIGPAGSVKRIFDLLECFQRGPGLRAIRQGSVAAAR